MFSEKLQPTLVQVLIEAGIYSCPRFYRDPRFAAAVVSGMLVLWLGHNWLPVFSSTLTLHWSLLLSVLLWQPFAEELFFRGIIQGQLRRFVWGQRTLLKLSAANVVTSACFAAVHMINTQPIWALTIFIPSLLFGYFRDRFDSIYPSLLLHGLYNAMVVVGLLLNGNAVFSMAG